MDAVFTKVTDYLDELRSVGKDKASLVRAQIEEVDLSLVQDGQGGHGSGSQFVVVSGFHDDRYFYQGMFDCGTATGRSDKPQRDAAEATLETIRKACGEIGVEMRGGQWLRP